jgi:hypothetical protein
MGFTDRVRKAHASAAAALGATGKVLLRLRKIRPARDEANAFDGNGRRRAYLESRFAQKIGDDPRDLATLWGTVAPRGRAFPMLIDRAIALFGLAMTMLLGLYTFAPEGWPKVPPAILLFGLALSILILGFGAGLVSADYRKSRRQSFEIEFDQRDARFVRIENDRTRYLVILRNLTRETIAWPSVRVERTAFTEEAFRPSDPYNWGQPADAILIFVGGALDPGAREPIELFAISHRLPDTGLAKERHRFTLEARGRNAETLLQPFEYDPNASPRVKKC